ncbi:glycine zipper family protein [Azospirillum sp. ST 5-10]|uniref:glycine zipper family protein n=1 Tax=unclassified Azospirillum TaxID=2630922 RepID=UPI003F49B481
MVAASVVVSGCVTSQQDFTDRRLSSDGERPPPPVYLIYDPGTEAVRELSADEAMELIDRQLPPGAIVGAVAGALTGHAGNVWAGAAVGAVVDSPFLTVTDLPTAPPLRVVSTADLAPPAERWIVDSRPTGADVYVNGARLPCATEAHRALEGCTTKLKIRRVNPGIMANIRIEKSGYKPCGFADTTVTRITVAGLPYNLLFCELESSTSAHP